MQGRKKEELMKTIINEKNINVQDIIRRDPVTGKTYINITEL